MRPKALHEKACHCPSSASPASHPKSLCSGHSASQMSPQTLHADLGTSELTCPSTPVWPNPPLLSGVEASINLRGPPKYKSSFPPLNPGAPSACFHSTALAPLTYIFFLSAFCAPPPGECSLHESRAQLKAWTWHMADSPWIVAGCVNACMHEWILDAHSAVCAWIAPPSS